LELVFEKKYGKIVDYKPFGDGYIAIGFSEGFIAHISTFLKELSCLIFTFFTLKEDELNQERVFQGALEALCTNTTLNKLAVASGSIIKIFNLSTWKEIEYERLHISQSAGRIIKMDWIPNGQLLVIATSGGHLLGYITSIPSLSSNYGPIASILTSFTEISIRNCHKPGKGVNLTTLNLEIEPGFLSNGPLHLAAGMNNIVWYYRWRDYKSNKVIDNGNLVYQRDYMSAVKQVILNHKWAAVLCAGKCCLHPIEMEENQDEEERQYPQTSNE